MVIAYPILYSKYEIHSRKGLPLLYFKMNKTLYGLPKISIMLYKNLRGELESIGFLINPCYPYVVNNNINSTHMTITCHVYDLKVSHKDASDITKFGMWLEGIYGKNLTFRMGKVHDYLAMDLDYSEKVFFEV